MIGNRVGEAVDGDLGQPLRVRRFDLPEAGPVQQRLAGGRRVEQAVQVGAEDLSVLADGAVRAVAQLQRRAARAGPWLMPW